jgi:hypothetical protein
MRENEIVTESNVHCKQANHAIREALQDEIENAQTNNPARRNRKCSTGAQRALYQLRRPLNALSNHLAPK